MAKYLRCLKCCMGWFADPDSTCGDCGGPLAPDPVREGEGLTIKWAEFVRAAYRAGRAARD